MDITDWKEGDEVALLVFGTVEQVFDDGAVSIIAQGGRAATEFTPKELKHIYGGRTKYKGA